MRDIEFRAWDLRKNLWIDNFIIDQDGTIWDRDTDENLTLYAKLLQFTGLKDKNGKKVFEGDILGVASKHSIRPDTKVVTWEKEGFWNIAGNGIQYAEVVGNIYENPELIKS